MARGGGSSGGGSRGGGSGGSRGSGGRSGGSSSVGRSGGFSGGFSGRSGGSSGSRRGSGSSGGRSGGFGGGFSGGSGGSSSSRPGNSSFGSGHRPVGGFFGTPRPRAPRPVIYYGGGGNRQYSSGNSGCGLSGCGPILFIGIIVIIVLVVMFSPTQHSGTPYDVTKSTIVREPLPAGSVNETAYFTDEVGWIGNRTKLLTGLKNFYNKTGVQPHLYIIDEVNGSHYPTDTELADFAGELYDELFTDEAHILMVFFEYDNMYMTRYITGSQAKTVIDDEAGDILLDYLDKYYYDNSLTDEEYFSKAFDDAAKSIMQVYRSPWVSVWVVIGVIVLSIILYSWWKKAKEQKNKEAEMAEKILNTPLEIFGDKEAEELGKKYED